MKPAILGLYVILFHLTVAMGEAPRQGAALLKTDILALFAHPDDESGMAATLAHYALSEGKAVATVYCTRGEGGGNMVGTHWGTALGILREAELRGCLETLGVSACYFLDRLDWAYTESAAATFSQWDRKQTLELLVRLVRALRPEIIVTMNPAPTPGQHGHHQAAAMLAAEAFTAAADPNSFPLQLSKEGLAIWQPRRLFFGSGSGRVVSTIVVDTPTRDGATPAQVAARALAHHRSQAFGTMGSAPWLSRPQKFSLIKTYAPLAGVESNLLAGLPLPDSRLPAQPLELARALPRPALDLQFVPRPAVAAYRRWSQEQQIDFPSHQFVADLPLVAGETDVVQLELHNTGGSPAEGALKLDIAGDWKTEGPPRLQVGARSHATVEVRVSPPETAMEDVDLRAELTGNNMTLEAKARLHPLPRAKVKRLSAASVFGGPEWMGLETHKIASPGHLVQGKVTGDADSSAAFKLGHNATTLFIDVEVRDDSIVTNIAPNDIKGHWRSDSVEICLDPTAGAEHTLGAYKLGVFPFDTTGVVRGARDADANQGPVEETARGTRLLSSRTKEGYRIRAAIPFTEIGVVPGQKRLGFNLIVYDGDKPEAAIGENINKSRLAWAPRAGVQGRPEDWGKIDLE